MQSYASHIHHPVPTYIASVLWLFAAVAFTGSIAFGWDARDSAFGWLMASALVLISISRTYTTKLQDRIIMLEMKVRCAEVLPAGEDAKLTRLGQRVFSGSLQPMKDPWGREIFWIGGGAVAWSGSEDSDFRAVRDGYISITPLHLDLTARDRLDDAASWWRPL